MQSLRPRCPTGPILVVDNYDSFTYNLVQLLGMLGASVVVRPNDAPDLPQTAEDLARFAGVLLSPGPSSPERSGRCLELLALCAQSVPVLGVCLGHQVIALQFGARVARSARPWHGKTSRIRHSGRGIFRGVPDGFLAARYNSLAVCHEQLPPCLEVTAWDEHGEIMALCHRSLSIVGVQFHPESVLSEHGERLLANWLESVAETETAAPPPERDERKRDEQ